MEESNATEICTNCKREIPAANFMTHSVHCSRNIKICTVCKEPVPQNELQDHHDRLHKLVPCKKCQEMVRGTDMEDHIRDSCDFTMQTCRFCALELRRREMPAHERYCGSRTERCADCGEYVMLRYRQLHLDSNHSFLCLDEDTPAAPAPSAIKTPILRPFPNYVNMQTGGSKTPPKPSTDLSSFRNRRPPVTEEQIRERIMANFPLFNPQGPSDRPDEPRRLAERISRPELSLPQPAEPKKTPEKPEKSKNESVRLNGVRQKKRAPPPPEPAAKAERDLPFFSALQRRLNEQERRRQLNERNLANGLPPVLDPLSKLEKLRKMDALQNPERPDDKDYKNILQGRVWQHNSNISPGHRLGEGSSRDNGRPNGESTSTAQSADSRTSLKDIQPMSVDEFAARLRQLQLRNEPTVETDRFGEIRSSLRDLRRGLNEVTAPYNNNNSMGNNNLAMDLNYTSTTTDGNDFGQLAEARARSPAAETEVVVPCEFCARPLPASRLAQHESACSASLEQPARRPPQGGAGRSASAASEDDVPIIPCEFCTEALPYYLITEHQERCGREANLLYLD